MIFVDTGAFLARYHARDQYHDEATAFWRRLETEGERLYTSSFVLAETFTLLGRRAGYPFAAARARSVYRSRALTVLRPKADDETAALGFFEKYADQRLSFTDCLSFALMRRRRLTQAFTFDHHFALAGFATLPA